MKKPAVIESVALAAVALAQSSTIANQSSLRVTEDVMTRIFVAATLIVLTLGLSARGYADPRRDAELLAAHNSYRASLGLPPLRWSNRLAASAQRWADHLAAIGSLEHSGAGQNLAMAASGTQSLAQLVDLWGNERAYFIDGYFPAISTTGNWVNVGHYSQMVWRTTTEVGCGFARNGGRDVLVCNYNPPGNVMGERAF